jgi:hypothetical protein
VGWGGEVGGGGGGGVGGWSRVDGDKKFSGLEVRQHVGHEGSY